MAFSAVRTLQTVVTCGTFASAANELGLTRAGLGQRIAALEKSIGVDLLYRQGKTVQLTPAGGVFLDKMRRAVDAFDAGLAELRGNDQIKDVTVAYTLTTEGQIVERLAERAEAQLPRIHLTFRRLWTSEASEAVAAGSVDVAIARHPPWWGDLRVEKLWETPLVLSVPKGHRLASCASVAIQEVAGEPISAVPRELSPGSYDIVESTFLAAGVLPHIVNAPVLFDRVKDRDPDVVTASVGPQLTEWELPPEFIQIPLEGPAGEARMGLHMVSRYSDNDNVAIAAVLHLIRQIAAEVRASADLPRPPAPVTERSPA